MENKAPHEELTQRIIGSAMLVHTDVGNVLDEKIYENGLCVEFADVGIFFEQQRRFPVHYKSKLLGTAIPDLIVENSVIVDTKEVEAFNESHISQMITYLKLANLPVGLLLNFKHATLGIKRVLNTRRFTGKEIKLH